MANDYERYLVTTKYWLYSYNRFKENLESLKAEREDISRIYNDYEDVNAPISKYGTQLVRSGASSSPVEVIAARRDRTKQQLDNIDNDISAGYNIINRITKAYSDMTIHEQDLIRTHYFEHKSWDEVAQSFDMSRKWATEKGNEAVRKIALLIFGSESMLNEYERMAT